MMAPLGPTINPSDRDGSCDNCGAGVINSLCVTCHRCQAQRNLWKCPGLLCRHYPCDLPGVCRTQCNNMDDALALLTQGP
eukprot:977743-Amphidinium_carterae.1